MAERYSISFVLPMFNESENIRRSVDELKMLAGDITDEYEIVIVDDASTDGSAEIVKDISGEKDNVRLFCLEKNTKFGGAFARGFKEARKDIIMYMDSDMPVSMEDIKESLPLIEENDIVTGYSKIKKGETVKRKIISLVYNLLVQMLFGLSVKDINSGYKIVKRDIVSDVDFISKSPFVDVELFIHAKRKGSKVRQFPLVFQTRLGGKSYIARIPVIWATFSDMIKVKIVSCKKN